MGRPRMQVFTGQDPKGWIAQAEKHFHFYGIMEDDKIEVARIHFEGAALGWLQFKEIFSPFQSWQEMQKATVMRFRSNQGVRVLEQKNEDEAVAPFFISEEAVADDEDEVREEDDLEEEDEVEIREEEKNLVELVAEENASLDEEEEAGVQADWQIFGPNSLDQKMKPAQEIESKGWALNDKTQPMTLEETATSVQGGEFYNWTVRDLNQSAHQQTKPKISLISPPFANLQPILQIHIIQNNTTHLHISNPHSKPIPASAPNPLPTPNFNYPTPPNPSYSTQPLFKPDTLGVSTQENGNPPLATPSKNQFPRRSLGLRRFSSAELQSQLDHNQGYKWYEKYSSNHCFSMKPIPFFLLHADELVKGIEGSDEDAKEEEMSTVEAKSVNTSLGISFWGSC